jgi:hypothetical protein
LERRLLTGGRYETGVFHFKGRSYSNRYFFERRYLYGGTMQTIQTPAKNPRGRITLINSTFIRTATINLFIECTITPAGETLSID